MKIKSDYVLRNIAGDYVLVPTGESVAKHNGLFGMTDVGARIIEIMPECANEEDIVRRILEEYDADEETVKRDVAEFVSSVRELGILEE